MTVQSFIAVVYRIISVLRAYNRFAIRSVHNKSRYITLALLVYFDTF